MLNHRLAILAASAAFALLSASPAAAQSCGAPGQASLWSCENPIALATTHDSDTRDQRAAPDRTAGVRDEGNTGGGGGGGDDGEDPGTGGGGT